MTDLQRRLFMWPGLTFLLSFAFIMILPDYTRTHIACWFWMVPKIAVILHKWYGNLKDKGEVIGQVCRGSRNMADTYRRQETEKVSWESPGFHSMSAWPAWCLWISWLLDTEEVSSSRSDISLVTYPSTLLVMHVVINSHYSEGIIVPVSGNIIFHTLQHSSPLKPDFFFTMPILLSSQKRILFMGLMLQM